MMKKNNNEIIASSVTNKIGSSIPYYQCLNTLIEKTKEQSYTTSISLPTSGH